jgi:hypothetical protein
MRTASATAHKPAYAQSVLAPLAGAAVGVRSSAGAAVEVRSSAGAAVEVRSSPSADGLGLTCGVEVGVVVGVRVENSISRFNV